MTTNLDASDGICNRRYLLYSWRWRHFPSFIRGSFSSLRYFFLTPSPPSTPLTYFVGLVKLTGDRASTASCVSVTDSRTTTCHEQRNRWEKLDSSIKWKNTCKGLENGLESKFEECKEKRNESTSNQVSESEGCSIGWSGGGMGLRRGGGSDWALVETSLWTGAFLLDEDRRSTWRPFPSIARLPLTRSNLHHLHVVPTLIRPLSDVPSMSPRSNGKGADWPLRARQPCDRPTKSS